MEMLTSINGGDDPIDISIKKYELHPSIFLIKEKVSLDIQKFSFSLTDLIDMEKEIKSFNPKKATTFNNIPAKNLKYTFDICSPTLKKYGVRLY